MGKLIDDLNFLFRSIWALFPEARSETGIQDQALDAATVLEHAGAPPAGSTSHSILQNWFTAHPLPSKSSSALSTLPTVVEDPQTILHTLHNYLESRISVEILFLEPETGTNQTEEYQMMWKEIVDVHGKVMKDIGDRVKAVEYRLKSPQCSCGSETSTPPSGVWVREKDNCENPLCRCKTLSFGSLDHILTMEAAHSGETSTPPLITRSANPIDSLPTSTTPTTPTSQLPQEYALRSAVNNFQHHSKTLIRKMEQKISNTRDSTVDGEEEVFDNVSKAISKLRRCTREGIGEDITVVSALGKEAKRREDDIVSANGENEGFRFLRLN